MATPSANALFSGLKPPVAPPPMSPMPTLNMVPSPTGYVAPTVAPPTSEEMYSILNGLTGTAAAPPSSGYYGVPSGIGPTIQTPVANPQPAATASMWDAWNFSPVPAAPPAAAGNTFNPSIAMIDPATGQAIGTTDGMGMPAVPGQPSYYGVPTSIGPTLPGSAQEYPLGLANPEAAGLTNFDSIIASLMPTIGGAYNPAMEAAWNAAKAAGGPTAMQTGAEGYLSQGTQMGVGESQALATIQQLLSQAASNPYSQQAMQWAGQGVAPSSAEQDALAQLGFFTGGALGSSPATQAAMEAFGQFAVPEITQQLSLAGLGRSGAVGQAIGDAQAKAMVPLLQTEMSNRLQAAGLGAEIGGTQQARALEAAGIAAGLSQQEISALLQGAGIQAEIGGAQQGRSIQAGQAMGAIGSDIANQALQSAQLRATLGTNAAEQQLQAAQLAAGISGQQTDVGNTLAQRARSDVAAALEAAGLSRDIANQQAEALYQEFMRLFNLSGNASMDPALTSLGDMFGSKTKQPGGGGGMFGS